MVDADVRCSTYLGINHLVSRAQSLIIVNAVLECRRGLLTSLSSSIAWRQTVEPNCRTKLSNQTVEPGCRTTLMTHAGLKKEYLR